MRKLRAMLAMLAMVALTTTAHAEKDKDKDKKKKDEDEKHESRSSGGGDFSVSGGISPGDDTFAAALGFGYGFTKLVAIDVAAHYESLDQKSYAGKQYGGHVAFVVRGRNPTPVTPFIGAGPGYEKWKRSQDSKTFDDAGSVTGVAFVGVSVGIGSHVAIQAQRRDLTYLQRTPVYWSDHAVHEPKSRFSNQIGFVIGF